MLFDALLTLFFVILNGFFVAAEFAIVKVRASQIEIKVKKGSRLAKLAQNLVSNLDSYLSATQLGITLASLGLGFIGESVVAKMIIELFHYFNLQISDASAHTYALYIAFASITFLHIVFGELAPKSIAIQKPEQVTMFVAVPMRLFYLVFRPFIWGLNTFANYFLKVLGFEGVSEEDNLHSADELKYLIKESGESGLINESEQELIENVFEFSETPIRQLMVPRQNIVGIELNMPKEEMIDFIIDEGYSRLPVYDKTIDNIVGLIYSKDMLNLMRHSSLFIVADLIRPIISVDEEERVNKVLNHLKTTKTHFAVVTDEFGGTAGIVTLEDIIEEIFGDIEDEYDDEQKKITNVTENEFVMTANSLISDINEFLPVPIPESDDWDTIGGFVLSQIGKIPSKGDIIDLENYECKILSSSERRIEELKLTFIDKTQFEEED